MTIETKTNDKTKKEKFSLKEPTLRNNFPNNFVDVLLNIYGQQLKANGEAYDTTLDYFTVERNSFDNQNELECIKKYGFAPIGFLMFLRAHMSKNSGLGLCKTNRDFDKALLLIGFDLKISTEDLQKLHQQLCEFNLLININDSQGNIYITTYQQIFNYETLCWTRARNRFYQNQWKKKNQDGENNDSETESSPNEMDQQSNLENTEINPIKAEEKPNGAEQFGLTDDDGKEWF